MTERDWELYRLSVVEQLPEGPYKDAMIAGIRHKLHLLDLNLLDVNLLDRPGLTSAVQRLLTKNLPHA